MGIFHEDLMVWCKKLRQYKLTLVLHKNLLVKCEKLRLYVLMGIFHENLFTLWKRGAYMPYKFWGYTGSAGGMGLMWVYPLKNVFAFSRGKFN